MIFIPDSVLIKQFTQAVERTEYGSLTVTSPEGKTTTYKASNPGVDADIQVKDWSFLWQTTMRGDIGLGETYIEGKWDTSSVEDLIHYFLQNLDAFEKFSDGSWFNRMMFNILNKVVRANSKRGSSKNIASHYDVGNDFYKLWLDETMTYSSALFEGEDRALTDAQKAKYGRILGKMDNKERLFEVGCGWGGFAEEASEKGHNVTGITISNAQYDFAKKRLNNKADIRLQDYRDTEGKFDGIVSIEMFEAVGERYWPSYFQTLKNRLEDSGKAVIQTITIHDDIFDDYRTRSDFIRQYTFPGGMLPSLKRFKEEAEKVGLKAVDVHSFGHDYAETLRHWLKRFNGKKEAMLKLGYDESFMRNWNFYMGMCAGAFAKERTNVVQVELQHA